MGRACFTAKNWATGSSVPPVPLADWGENAAADSSRIGETANGKTREENASGPTDPRHAGCGLEELSSGQFRARDKSEDLVAAVQIAFRRDPGEWTIFAAGKLKPGLKLPQTFRDGPQIEFASPREIDRHAKRSGDELDGAGRELLPRMVTRRIDLLIAAVIGIPPPRTEVPLQIGERTDREFSRIFLP